MKKIALILLAIIALLCISVISIFYFTPSKYDFKAQTLNGELKLSEVKKPVILYFGYTYCPDICPTTLFLVSNALDELKLDAQIIFVSVDLQRDDLKDCDIYAKHFRDDAICARLEKNELDEIIKTYGANYKIENQNNEISVAHTPYVYLLKNARLISEVTNLASKSLKRELEKLR